MHFEMLEKRTEYKTNVNEGGDDDDDKKNNDDHFVALRFFL